MKKILPESNGARVINIMLVRTSNADDGRWRARSVAQATAPDGHVRTLLHMCVGHLQLFHQMGPDPVPNGQSD